MTRIFSPLLVASALAGCLLVGAPAASAQQVLTNIGTMGKASDYASRLGVSTHLRYYAAPDARYQVQRISASGIKWIREDFSWAQTEPERGQYDWYLTDKIMGAASTANVDVFPVLGYSPEWASSDPTGAGGSTYPPRSNADYARFVDAVIARYGTNGSYWRAHPDFRAKPLRAIQLWNEPWGFFSWRPDPDPAAYAALVKTASAAAHARDRNLKVVVVGDVLQTRTDKTYRRWIDELLTDKSLFPYVDAWGMAAYPAPWNQGPYDAKSKPEWNFGRVQMVRDLTVAAGAAKPIWITEFGWSTGAGDVDRVSEATQATYMRDAARRAVEEWGPFVERAFAFTWDKPSESSGSGHRDFALRHEDDSITPAWKALSDLARFGSPTAATPNVQPIANFTSDLGYVRTWDKVFFNSNSRDPDGRITSTVWDNDNDGYFDDEWRYQTTRTYKWPGDYRIRLRVTDNRGAQSVAVWVVHVVKRPPGP